MCGAATKRSAAHARRRRRREQAVIFASPKRREAAGRTVNRGGPRRRGFRWPAMTGPGAAAGAGVALPRSYAARSMAGSQPVPLSNSAARSAMSPFLSAAMLSAAALPLASMTASQISVLETRPR